MLKQLRSFMGAVNHFNKFIPNLLAFCSPIRSVPKTRNCVGCQQTCKKWKCLKSQNEFRKLQEASKSNKKVSLGFAGSFQNVNIRKQFRLISEDNHSEWPVALFLANPTTEKVNEFVLENISSIGKPEKLLDLNLSGC